LTSLPKCGIFLPLIKNSGDNMKKLFAIAALIGTLSGCVVSPAYEPAPVVGVYPIGYYDPAYGYWTGYGWDVNFYLFGHPGYGHHYYPGRYAPRGYYHYHH